MDKDSYKLIPLAQLMLSQVLKFLGIHFDYNEPMCRHLKITSEQFCKGFGPIIKTCYESGFSFAMKFKGEVISMLLSTPFVDLQKCVSQIPNDHYSPNVSIIVAMLTRVESQYRPKDPNKTIYHFILSTKEQFRGNGIIQRIGTHIEQEGVSKGYLEHYGQCTGKISQKFAQKNGYYTEKQVFYRKFQFQGKYPFKALTSEDSIKLMVKKMFLPAL